MKKQIAAGAETEEILGFQNGGVSSRIAAPDQLLAKAADIVRAVAKTALGDQRPRCLHRPAGFLAIKTQQHETARPQQGQQCAPTGEGIGQMMEHAQALNQIEPIVAFLKLENVGLGVGDRKAQLFRLAPGIAEAGETEIHRQHIGCIEFPGYGDGALTGTAACDQYIFEGASGGTFERRMRKLAIEEICDGVRCLWHRPDPAWIGVVLILILHHARYRVFDPGQPRNIGAQALFLKRLTQLLG